MNPEPTRIGRLEGLDEPGGLLFVHVQLLSEGLGPDAVYHPVADLLGVLPLLAGHLVVGHPPELGSYGPEDVPSPVEKVDEFAVVGHVGYDSEFQLGVVGRQHQAPLEGHEGTPHADPEGRVVVVVVGIIVVVVIEHEVIVHAFVYEDVWWACGS